MGVSTGGWGSLFVFVSASRWLLISCAYKTQMCQRRSQPEVLSLMEQSLVQGLQWPSPLKIKRKLAVLSAAKLSLKTCVPYNVTVVKILMFGSVLNVVHAGTVLSQLLYPNCKHAARRVSIENDPTHSDEEDVGCEHSNWAASCSESETKRQTAPSIGTTKAVVSLRISK